MEQNYYYKVNLKWKKGRVGEVSSPDLDTVIECATPPEFEGGVPNIWSPEHFYAAAINSCFMTTFLAIAEKSRLDFEKFECATKIKLERPERKFLITEAELIPELKLKNPEKDRDKAMRVFQKTNENCLVTNSMKTEVNLNPKIC